MVHEVRLSTLITYCYHLFKSTVSIPEHYTADYGGFTMALRAYEFSGISEDTPLGCNKIYLEGFSTILVIVLEVPRWLRRSITLGLGAAVFPVLVGPNRCP